MEESGPAAVPEIPPLWVATQRAYYVGRRRHSLCTLRQICNSRTRHSTSNLAAGFVARFVVGDLALQFVWGVVLASRVCPKEKG
jgi:hypothetical protein